MRGSAGQAVNWADYCILAALGLSVLMGLWRGFIGEVLALLGWALAFWVAWRFGAQLSQHLMMVDEPSLRLLLGYALCFIAVLLAVGLLAFLMRKLVAGSGLSGSDRLLGMVFGLARGLVLVTLVVLLFGFTPLPRDAWWRQSQLLPAFSGYAQWLSTRLPAEVTKYLDLRGVVPQIAQPAPHDAGAERKTPQAR